MCLLYRYSHINRHPGENTNPIRTQCKPGGNSGIGYFELLRITLISHIFGNKATGYLSPVYVLLYGTNGIEIKKLKP